MLLSLVLLPRTRRIGTLNMWRLPNAPNRTPLPLLCFDISLYFSLYFPSLQLMTVCAVTAQAWRCFARSRHHLVLHSDTHLYACVHPLAQTKRTRCRAALVNLRLLLIVYNLKGHGAGRGGCGERFLFIHLFILMCCYQLHEMPHHLSPSLIEILKKDYHIAVKKTPAWWG